MDPTLEEAIRMVLKPPGFGIDAAAQIPRRLHPPALIRYDEE
jgi:hypothetical protein